MNLYRYRLTFARSSGCPMGVLTDMARHDSATVLSIANDLGCAGNNIRTALLLGNVEPTMARWASFGLGAAIKSILTIVTDPYARGNGASAIEPGPR